MVLGSRKNKARIIKEIKNQYYILNRKEKYGRESRKRKKEKSEGTTLGPEEEE